MNPLHHRVVWVALALVTINTYASEFHVAAVTLDGFVSTCGNGYPHRPAGVSDDRNLDEVLPSFRYTEGSL